MSTIVFCGYANTDVMMTVPRVPLVGERVQATTVTHVDGGMIANAAVSAARMGASVIFAGAVGPDARSSEFLAALQQEGIDTSWAPRNGFLSTAVVMVTPDGDRSIISQDDANDADAIAAVLQQLVDSGGGWLYLDGYRADLLPDTMPESVQLVIDLDGCENRDAAIHSLSEAKHVLVGRALWENRFGFSASTWPDLAAANSTHLLVTDGVRGWTLVTPHGEVVTEPAVSVHVVDATGAGDCFGGAYVAFVTAGYPPEAAARRAGAAASLACTTTGPRGCPSLEELTQCVDQLGTPSHKETR